jgi:hypothetical protein
LYTQEIPVAVEFAEAGDIGNFTWFFGGEGRGGLPGAFRLAPCWGVPQAVLHAAFGFGGIVPVSA